MKYNFAKKRRVQILLFAVGLLMVTFCALFSSFSVHADGNTNLMGEYNIPTEIYPDDNSGFPWMPSDVNIISSGDSHYYSYFEDVYAETLVQNGFSVPTASFVSTETYPHYALANDGLDTKLYILPEDSFIVGNDNNSSIENGNFCIYINKDNAVSQNINNYLFSRDVYPWNYWTYHNFQAFGYQDEVQIDGDAYYRLYVSSSIGAYGFILNTDVPCYYSSSLSINTLDGLTDVNENSASGGLTQEQLENHLFLKDDTKFYLNNSSFNNGYLYLYPVLDTTQLADNEDLSQYYLRLVGTIQTNNSYHTDYQHRATSSNGGWTSLYFPMSVSGVNAYNFELKNSEGNFYDIPVDSVKNGEYKIELNDLHKQFYCTGGNDHTYQFLASGYDSLYNGTSYFGTVSNIVSSLSIKGVKFESNNVSEHECDIVPNKVYYHIDLYVVKKYAGNTYVGDVQSYIDGDICQGGISGENVNTVSDEELMDALGSDYVPSDYTSPSSNTDYGGTYNNVGGSSSSSSSPSVSPSISGGENNINIINNNTNNGSGSGSTSESSLGSWSITTLLIKYIAGGKNSGVSYIEDLAGTNTYLQIVSNYMGFVPTEIWSLVLTTFTASNILDKKCGNRPRT